MIVSSAVPKVIGLNFSEAIGPGKSLLTLLRWPFERFLTAQVVGGEVQFTASCVCGFFFGGE